MRAFDRSKFRFVDETYKQRILESDLCNQEIRDTYTKALQSLEKTLMELMSAATETDEMQFWQSALNRLRGTGDG